MESLNLQLIIFQFFGGLGIFLFSLKYMGDGLKLITGEKIRYLLDKYTTNPFLGVLVGIFVTALVQSSSATTVITVGLVSVGILNLRQAIGIVMGANIGTTITSFIIGFNINEYSMPIIFIGAALLFFTKNQRINNYGRAIFGFGGIFYALEIMSHAMIPLRHLNEVKDFLVNVSSNSIFGIILGTLLTIVIQSSSATIGILQNLYTDGLITLKGALPILFGDNIGTTITAILATIGASVAAKRVAAAHVLFNVLGTLIFLVLLAPFRHLLVYLQGYLHLNPKMTIAMAHGMFNTVNTLVMFPFVGFYVYIVTKLIPEKIDEDEKVESFLDRHFLNQTPLIAISQAHKELLEMFRITEKTLYKSIKYFFNHDEKLAKSVEKREATINKIDNNLTLYLSEVFSERLSDKESELVSSYLDITRDIERIGDHANNLSKEVTYQISKKMNFSKQATQEILEMEEVIVEMFNITKKNLLKDTQKEISEIYRLHNDIYKMESRNRKNHINRTKNQECDIKSGLQYVDVLNHLTRVCDHLKNINEKI